MKYKDKNTLMQQKKHLDKMHSDQWIYANDRTERRKKERELKKFAMVVCQYLDRFWWDALDTYQKQQLYYDSKSIEKDLLKDWLLEARKTIKINLEKYRANQIDTLI